MSAARLLLTLALLVPFSGETSAQGTPDPSTPNSAGIPTKKWSFSAEVAGYAVPESRSFLNPAFTADRGWLHLEARYNYEDLETGSLWVGYNMSFGEKLVFEATPMIGGVLGNTSGIAPGYGISLSYRRLALSSQGEYVIATGESDSFFYSWSELTYSPAEWFQTGIAAQKTKTYHTSLNVQRGLLAGFSHKNLSFTTYIFNVGWTDPTLVFVFGVDF